MTKKDENNTSEKEVYRLWWEYLKRSGFYQDYCKIKPPLRVILREDGKYNKYTVAVKKNLKTKKLMTAEVSFEEYLLIWNMERNWDAFGNIFKTTFDDWSEKRKKPNKELPVLALNDPDICTKLSLFAEKNKNLKRTKAKYPNPQQMLEQLTKSEPDYIFLAVPMVGNVTMEEIASQIAAIRLEYKKEPLYRLADYNYKRFKRPISRVRLDELKRYLRVYDLKQTGLTMKEIIAEIDPKRKEFDVDIVRSFRSDLKKAINLIHNVEHGIFPEEPIIVTDKYRMSLKQTFHSNSEKEKR